MNNTEDFADNRKSDFSLIIDENGIIKSIVLDDSFFFKKGRNIKDNFVFNLIPKKDTFFDLLLKRVKSEGFFVEKEDISFVFFCKVLQEDILFGGSKDLTKCIEIIEKTETVIKEDLDVLKLSAKKALHGTDPFTLNEQLFLEMSGLNNELINVRRELSRKNKELETTIDKKDKITSILAHDLRSPISQVIMGCEFLTESTINKLSEKENEILGLMLLSSEYLLSLLTDILELYQFNSGKFQIIPEKTDLGVFLDNNIRLNKIFAEKKRIEILSDFDLQLPYLFIDKIKINQVLNNLISNSIKFSNPGSNIYVKCDILETEVVISVRDYGVGVADDLRDKIFLPFSSGRHSGTSGEKSFGLGLSIVKDIVEKHGGRIWFVSEAGKGSTFSFSLKKGEPPI